MTDDVVSNSIPNPTPIITDLKKHLHEAKICVLILDSLIKENSFAKLSKHARNSLTVKLMNTVGNIEDATKATLRQIKKIKRVRPEDKLVDEHLVRAAAYLRHDFDLTPYLGANESNLSESDLPESDLPESDLPESDFQESDLPE